MIQPGAILSYARKDNAIELTLSNASARVQFLAEDTVRVQLAFGELPQERSYVFQQTTWEDRNDGLFPGRERLPDVSVDIIEEDARLLFKTKAVTLILNRLEWQLTLHNASGQVLHEDLPNRCLWQDRNLRLNHTFRRNDRDRWLGLGEKTGPLDHSGRRLRMENTDAVGYDPETADPLYKHIPFLIRADAHSDTFCGSFYHNAWPSEFDLGATRSGYWGEFASARFDGGQFDLTLLAGKSLADITTRFVRLTGLPPLMPRHSLGYLGSTMYYTELDADSDQAVLNFMRKCKLEQVPVSGFHLSSGYTTADDGKRYAFHWNTTRFKDPDAFAKQFSEQGWILSPNIKPGILSTHPQFKAMQAQGALICNAEGEPQLEQFWGGTAGYVDFTAPEGRDQWQQHLTESLISKGIFSIWNDNNEFEMMHDEGLCHGDGQAVPAQSMRPILSNLMAKVAYDAVRSALPDRRPFILSRAGFAGLQHWAHTWSGDNGSSWDYFRSNLTTMLSLSLSGVPFNGMDIGGFTGPSPEPELFLRWVQNGVFHPRFCIHSANADNTVTEPWMHGSTKHLIAEAIQLRYRFLPYLYQLAERSHRTGDPLVTPLLYHFWDDARVHEENCDFMLGRACLVPAIVEPGQLEKRQYFPAGEQFIDPQSGQWLRGGKAITIATPLERPTWYLRAGEWLVLQPDLSVPAFSFIGSLIESEFEFYWDDGESFAFEQGDFLRLNLTLTTQAQSMTLDWQVFGKPEQFLHEPLTFELFSKLGSPMSIEWQGRALPMWLYEEDWEQCDEGYLFDSEKQQLRVRIPAHGFSNADQLTMNFANRIEVSL